MSGTASRAPRKDRTYRKSISRSAVGFARFLSGAGTPAVPSPERPGGRSGRQTGAEVRSTGVIKKQSPCGNDSQPMHMFSVDFVTLADASLGKDNTLAPSPPPPCSVRK